MANLQTKDCWFKLAEGAGGAASFEGVGEDCKKIIIWQFCLRLEVKNDKILFSKIHFEDQFL